MSNLVTRKVNLKVRFQWDGSTWTDETAYVISVKGAQEYFPPNEAYQGGRQIIQRADVVLSNKSFRFSAWHSSSVLYSMRNDGGGYHRKCNIQVQIDSGTWVDLFTGYVKTPSESLSKGQVTFTVWDIGEILREKVSTSMLENYLEHDLIIYYLQNVAGLVDGVDFISPSYATAHSVSGTIDYSPMRIPWSWLDDEPVLDEAANVAQASGSRLYVDPSGRIHFEKGWAWPIFGASTPVVLSEDHYKEMNFSYDDKAFCDKVIVSYTPRFPGNGFEELWLLQEAKLVLPGATEKVSAKFKWPAKNVVVPVANTHYTVTTLDGQDRSNAVTPTIAVYAQKADVSITNNQTTPLVLAKMKFIGQPLMASPAEQIDKVIGGGTSFQHPVEVKTNFYIQSKTQAQAILDFLTWWYGSGKPICKLTGVRGDPSIKIGTRLQTKAQGVTLDGIVTRVEWQVSITNQAWAYVQGISTIQNVFADKAYFMIGVDTLGGAKKVWH